MSSLLSPGVLPVYPTKVVTGLVAVAGDSRGAFSSFPAALAQGCAIAYHNSWFHQLSQMLNGAIVNICPTAVSGTDVQSMASTQLAQILACNPRPTVVFEMCDVNNFYGAGSTADFVISQKCQFWRALSEAGIICVTGNSTPYAATAAGGTSGTGNNYSVAKQAQQLLYLDWINNNFARMFPGHIMVDTYSIAQANDRTLAPGWCYDGIHANWKYANAMATAFKSAMANKITFLQAITPRIVSTQDYAGATSVSNRKNMLIGSLIAGTIGQTTLPASWSVTSSTNAPSVAIDLQPSPYGVGNQLRCTVPFSGAGNFAVSYSETFAAGSRLRSPQIWIPSFIADIAQGSSLVTGIDIRATISDGTNTKYSFGGGFYNLDTSGSFATSVTEHLVMGAPMQFTTDLMGLGTKVTSDGITSIAIQCRVFTSGAGTVEFRVAEPALWTINPQSWDLSGTVGNVVIDALEGKCVVASGASTVTITNKYVTASSKVHALVDTDAANTCWIKSVKPSAGSFLITLNTAASNNVVVGFEVRN